MTGDKKNRTDPLLPWMILQTHPITFLRREKNYPSLHGQASKTSIFKISTSLYYNSLRKYGPIAQEPPIRKQVKPEL